MTVREMEVAAREGCERGTTSQLSAGVAEGALFAALGRTDGSWNGSKYGLPYLQVFLTAENS